MAKAVLTLALVLSGSPVFAQPGDWQYHDPDRGLHLRILKDYHLPAGSTAREPIVVLGGSATIDGHVEDDVVVIGGSLRVGSKAVVDGDAVAMGGRARIDPGARIAGDFEEVSIAGPELDFVWMQMASPWWADAAFGATIVRLALVFVVALLLIIVAPGWVGSIADRASPRSSLLLGITGQVLFVPAVVAITTALAISVIGLPLLAGIPLLVGAAALAWAAGLAAVAMRLGRRLRGRGATPSPAIDLFTGFVAISAVTVAAHAIALGPSWLSPQPSAWGSSG